jgi:lysophospholipase L1-like esterase
LVGLVPAGFGTVDVVTVTLGTNDVGRIGYNVSDFAYEAAKLLALLHATYPSAKIVWWLPPVTGIAARNTLLTTVVIPALQALQVANQTLLYLVDVNSVSAGADLGVILGVDGVHLTNYGYSVAANAFAGGICKALGWQ